MTARSGAILDQLYWMGERLGVNWNDPPVCAHSTKGLPCVDRSKALWHWFIQNFEDVGIDLAWHGMTPIDANRMRTYSASDLCEFIFDITTNLYTLYMQPSKGDPVITKMLILRKLTNNYHSGRMDEHLTLNAMDNNLAGGLRVFTDRLAEWRQNQFICQNRGISPKTILSWLQPELLLLADGQRLTSAVAWAQIGLCTADRKANPSALSTIGDLEWTILEFSGYFIDRQPRNLFRINNANNSKAKWTTEQFLQTVFGRRLLYGNSQLKRKHDLL
jgi:hypothetical protein